MISYNPFGQNSDTLMPREITHHGAIIEAIRNSGVISELVERDEDHFEYELDLELFVYGRSYAGKAHFKPASSCSRHSRARSA